MTECGQSKKQNENVKRSRIEALNRRAARVKCSTFQVWHNDKISFAVTVLISAIWAHTCPACVISHGDNLIIITRKNTFQSKAMVAAACNTKCRLDSCI